MLPWLVVPLILLVGLVLLVAAAYWALVVTEGGYLGPRVVTLLYDWGAASYDTVKDFDAGDEAYFLGQPLTKALGRARHPLVLDVATGTGRVPLALLRYLDFDGQIIALDRSRKMLHQAARKTQGYSGRVCLVLQDATNLPFADGAFDAVTCIEALEFLPDGDATLGEMVRVLRPGGTLVVTNRCGRDRWFFPGRAPSRPAFEARLARLGLLNAETWTWQEYYDLVWARRGEREGEREREREGPVGERRGLEDVLVCPACGATDWHAGRAAMVCGACGKVFAQLDGIVNLTNP